MKTPSPILCASVLLLLALPAGAERDCHGHECDPLPDLVVEARVLHQPLAPTATILITVSNVGTAQADDWFNVSYEASSLLDRGTHGTAWVPPLHEGQNVTFEFTWNVFGKVGWYEVQAEVDSDHAVRESNETNNHDSQVVRLPL